jgi:hypothetical protein
MSDREVFEKWCNSNPDYTYWDVWQAAQAQAGDGDMAAIEWAVNVLTEAKELFEAQADDIDQSLMDVAHRCFCAIKGLQKPAQVNQQLLDMPLELNAHTKEILGRPCFSCFYIAEGLRLQGKAIPRKAEEEQAVVIHWLLSMYHAHGADWKKEAAKYLSNIAAEQEGKLNE